jgi:hypothetical protein
VTIQWNSNGIDRKQQEFTWLLVVITQLFWNKVNFTIVRRQLCYLDEPRQLCYLDEPRQRCYLDESRQRCYLDEPRKRFYLDEPRQLCYLDEPRQLYYLDELRQLLSRWAFGPDSEPFSSTSHLLRSSSSLLFPWSFLAKFCMYSISSLHFSPILVTHISLL